MVIDHGESKNNEVGVCGCEVTTPTLTRSRSSCVSVCLYAITPIKASQSMGGGGGGGLFGDLPPAAIANATSASTRSGDEGNDQSQENQVDGINTNETEEQTTIQDGGTKREIGRASCRERV